jgi:hypothetical protein
MFFVVATIGAIFLISVTTFIIAFTFKNLFQDILRQN